MDTLNILLINVFYPRHGWLHQSAVMHGPGAEVESNKRGRRYKASNQLILVWLRYFQLGF